MARPSFIHDLDPLISGKLLAPAISRIAYATDFNEPSDNALHWAIQIAKANAADLLLFHVLPPPVPLFEAEPSEKPEAETALSLLLGQVNTTGVRATGSLLSGTDSIGKQIARAARLEKIDLIVMGTRDRSRIFNFFLGRSVARAVVAQAECPVLVIPFHRVNTTRRIFHA